MFSSNANNNHSDGSQMKQYARLLINYLNAHADKLGSRINLLHEYDARLVQANDYYDVAMLNDDIKDLVLEITSSQHYKDAHDVLSRNQPTKHDNTSVSDQKIEAIQRYVGHKPSQAHSRPADAYDYYFKLIIAGDSGVGKSCMLLRFTDDTYTPHYIFTTGKNKTIDINNKKVKLEVWDTMGQLNKILTNSHYRGAHAYVVAFDITDQVSFGNVKQSIQEIKRYARKDVPILIVGTKSDLVSQRAVETDAARAYAKSIGCHYIETSAKNGINIDEAFATLANTVLLHMMPKQLPVHGNIPSQLKSLLQHKNWHSLTSHHGQPSGFKKMVGILDKMTNQSDDVKLTAIKEIADERKGSVVKRFILPNGIRNLQLRRVYQKILDTNSLTEALVMMQGVHKTLTQQQNYDARFK